MTRETIFTPRLYRGVFIYRNGPGHALRYYTITPRLAADTLEGIKQAIREATP
jgi:hypothetical protein